MLPVIDDEYGTRTFRQILLYLAVLVPVTLLPTVLGMSGYVYGVGALVLGVGFGAAGILLARNRTVDYARLMVKTSVIYLPLLFVLISLDLGH